MEDCSLTPGDLVEIVSPDEYGYMKGLLGFSTVVALMNDRVKLRIGNLDYFYKNIDQVKKAKPFVVGEKVKIKKPFNCDMHPCWLEQMDIYDGTVCEIEDVYLDENTVLVNNEWEFNLLWLCRNEIQKESLEYRKTFDGFLTCDKNWDKWLI